MRSFIGFDGLRKTLDCMPAAHGSGTAVVQDCVGRVVSRVDDRRVSFVAKGGDWL